MKRCPQCEFLYEDDQRLCDMDGVRLVFDSRRLPNLNALAIDSATTKPTWTSRTLALLAGLVLTIVFYLVYQVQTQQTRLVRVPAATGSPVQNQLVPLPETKTEGATPRLAEEPKSVVVTEPKQAKSEERPSAKEAPKPKSEKSIPTTDPSKKTKVKKAAAGLESRGVSQRKSNSKVVSFLKRTVKILKKPFVKK